ncbi:MAG: hypothetical protein LPK80_06050 [Bacteroidota bacterium]|nr:hypothetical protein [Bacteroidota bacterium]MDX5405299.1 hypothetical protein [Bacteroidota bacterium]MDX5428321.1 hypothetical protein [Bacteroidota bacterium]MDX5446994.1 hypothetical protein [Bacteroidota bacterium]MDX5506098.1 hypothetical protein [Bacteroidota bacterium]
MRDQIWLELVKLVKFVVITLLLYWLFSEPIRAAFSNSSRFQILGIEFEAKTSPQDDDRRNQLIEMEEEVDQEIEALKGQLQQLEDTRNRIQEKLRNAETPSGTTQTDEEKRPSWLTAKPQRLKGSPN